MRELSRTAARSRNARVRAPHPLSALFCMFMYVSPVKTAMEGGRAPARPLPSRSTMLGHCVAALHTTPQKPPNGRSCTGSAGLVHSVEVATAPPIAALPQPYAFCHVPAAA